jgi:hypothetical protein
MYYLPYPKRKRIWFVKEMLKSLTVLMEGVDGEANKKMEKISRCLTKYKQLHIN